MSVNHKFDIPPNKRFLSTWKLIKRFAYKGGRKAWLHLRACAYSARHEFDFPLTFRHIMENNIAPITSSAMLNLWARKTGKEKSHDNHDVSVFEKFRFQDDLLKRLVGVFGGEFIRIRVEVAFSNFSGIVWTRPHSVPQGQATNTKFPQLFWNSNSNLKDPNSILMILFFLF